MENDNEDEYGDEDALAGCRGAMNSLALTVIAAAIILAVWWVF